MSDVHLKLTKCFNNLCKHKWYIYYNRPLSVMYSVEFRCGLCGSHFNKVMKKETLDKFKRELNEQL